MLKLLGIAAVVFIGIHILAFLIGVIVLVALGLFSGISFFFAVILATAVLIAIGRLWRALTRF